MKSREEKALQRFRTAYDFGDTRKYGFRNEAVDEKTGEVLVLESMTAQEFDQFCDANRIIKRWQATGVLEHTARYQGQYGVFVGPESYHEAMNRITEARSMFETLPASMRAEFGNDVGRFLEYVNDDANREEMIQRGLMPRPRNDQSSEQVAGGKPASPATAEGGKDQRKADPVEGEEPE